MSTTLFGKYWNKTVNLMGRRHQTRTIINYIICAALVYLAYKYFLGNVGEKPADPFRGASKEHPKHLKHRQRPATSPDKEKIPVVQQSLEEGKQPKEDSNDEVKVNVGDFPKDTRDGQETLHSLFQNEKNHLMNKTGSDKQGQEGGGHNQRRTLPIHGEVDWELEEEMKKRREEFFKNLKEREEQLEEIEHTNLKEPHDDITFVTGSSHSTYYATLQLIYSVQYLYPKSQLVIYDIGLTSDEKQFIGSLCSVSVASLYLHLWPEHMYRIRNRIWRPLLLQFAVSKFGHCVYVEPGVFLNRQLIKDYLERSRIHGVVLGGKQMKYSTFFVTSPHMYTFIATDEKRLMKTPHIEFTIMIIHNTRRVAHFFLRFLMSCTLEEYCISPPGAQPKCHKYHGGRKYGGCHKYDESAINLILNKWHNYNPKEYFMKDLITMRHDGLDVTDKVQVCHDNNHKVET